MRSGGGLCPASRHVEQQELAVGRRADRDVVLVRDGSAVSGRQLLAVHRDGAGDEVTHATERTRKGWVQVASGAITVNGEELAAGDGAAIAYEDNVAIRASADSELLLFDMA